VVFEGPYRIPEIGAIGGHHAAFAGGGEDLVLAEAPGSHITTAAHGLSVDAGAMGLGQASITAMQWARASLMMAGILAGLGSTPRQDPTHRAIVPERQSGFHSS
jgi:hypothetical protein